MRSREQVQLEEILQMMAGTHKTTARVLEKMSEAFSELEKRVGRLEWRVRHRGLGD